LAKSNIGDIMAKVIKEIDEKHIAIIETNVNERLVAKVTLEAQKESLLQQIAEIDTMLTHFKAKAK
jgi:hypothetical protein